MVIEMLAWLACAVGLLITALSQPKRKLRLIAWLKIRDVFALIPTWTFFAPNPGVSDTRLLWRERWVDGGVSVWHESDPPITGYVRAVWNPRKRVRKAITDVGPLFARRVGSDPKSMLPLVSLPFLMMLAYVSSRPGSQLVSSRQFVVVQTQGPDRVGVKPNLLVLSNWHALTPETEAGRPGDRTEEGAR
jgi:hypothetical protein